MNLIGLLKNTITPRKVTHIIPLWVTPTNSSQVRDTSKYLAHSCKTNRISYKVIWNPCPKIEMIGGLGFLGDKVILHDKPLLWKWTIWPKLDCSLTKTVTKLWPQTVTKLWPKKKEFVAGVFLKWRIMKNTKWFQYYLDMGVELNGRGGEIRTPDILLPKLATRKNGYSRKLCVCNVF